MYTECANAPQVLKIKKKIILLLAGIMSPLSSKAGCRPKWRCCLLSPGAKRIKKAIGKAVQEEAFKEILKLRDFGNGKLRYGDMDKVETLVNIGGG